MASWPPSFTRERAAGAARANEIDDAPSSTVIAVQRSGLGELVDRAGHAGLRAVACLSPLMTLSKYGLGVALILCVTVIWVASSVWIQHIFGSLDFNKPFFLTYFNTTGFCLWNVGFVLSARWRRTPWDETSRMQPVCVEDARLESRALPPTVEAESQKVIKEEREDCPSGEHGDARSGMGEQHVGVDEGSRMPCVCVCAVGGKPHSNGAVAGVDPTLSHGVPPRRRLAEWELQRSLSLNSSLSHSLSRAEPRLPQLPLYCGGPPSQSTMTSAITRSDAGPLPVPHTPLRQVLSDGDVANRTLMVDNDDTDDGGIVDVVTGSEAQLHVADECRDYSLPTSSASSAQEEVVSVALTDEDELADAVQWQAVAHRDIIISSDMLRRNDTRSSQRRCCHRRARRQRIRRYSLRRIWRCALFFCPFWFLANYLFNLSLSITSVASNTILSSTSSIWTLFLSYVLLRQRVGAHRLVAVALSVSGTIMVGLSDKGAAGGRSTLGGNIAALLSAFFYATYTSVLKFHLPDDERFAMGMVFGAVGVLNVILLWPGLVLLSVTGAEPFVWPSWKQFWPLLMNSLIGTNLSDVLWARSVVLTSPVVATLGLSLTTPLAMVVDAVSKDAHFSGVYVAGAILVMAGFLLANLPIQINLGV
ncbi:hypothetical protein LSCM1_07297 [Leishmania martiniquensis]|uniref:EamA domain-containing protein n=1 Tax=Leishmania martiniquensis TaxID=1580590 RepID=A0A836I173_9TRYP|nr:hypothetical protein LSCM1_07297 [Leishmania martiniquensis]